MEVDELLRRWGGVATWAQLTQRASRAEVATAMARGSVLRLGHGRYGLPHLTADVARAHALTAVLSHESAALHQGWPVLLVPESPHLTVRVKRRLRARDLPDVHLHRADLEADDLAGSWTSQDRTMLDCLRIRDLRRSLAVADSALRAGRTPAWLHAIAAQIRGPGAVQARFVSAHATELSANPFESGLRAIGLEVSGLTLRPQVRLYSADGEFLGRPDLVDADLGIIAEADSFEWHGARSALVKDARRYNEFVVRGWAVLRFTWEDVMFEPERVRSTLQAAAFQRSQLALTGSKRPFRGIDSVQMQGRAQKPKVR